MILSHIWSQITESHYELSKHTHGRWKSQPDIVNSDRAVILEIPGFCRTTLKSKSHSYLGAPCSGAMLSFMKPANLPSHYHKLFSFPLWCLAKAHASFIVGDCAFHRYAKAKGRALNSLSAVLKMRSQSVWEVSGRLRNRVMTEWAVVKCQHTPWSVLCVFMCVYEYETETAVWIREQVLIVWQCICVCVCKMGF